MHILRLLLSAATRIKQKLDNLFTRCLFSAYGVKHYSFWTSGIPNIFTPRCKASTPYITLGKNFVMNNGISGNPIGPNEKCLLAVFGNGSITVGNNVGISQCSLVAYAPIKIGNYVKIGGGTCVWTTDYHSLDWEARRSKDDCKYRNVAPVTIEDDAFIGAKSIILKGVTIGRGAIVGAGAVVTKSIPPMEIWGGNPARFIRRISNEQ